MELCLFWLTTIICSFGMNISVSYKMIKDLADNGYKLNLKNIKKFNEQLKDNDVKKMHQIKILIPILNVMESMDLMMKYNNMRAFIVDELRILDSLEEMTKEEFEMYKKNPTVTNALKSTKNIDRFTSIKIDNGNSTVYFKFIGNSRDIEVLKTVGPASSLSKDEISEEVKKELQKLSFKEMTQLIIKNDANIVDLDSIDENNNNLTSGEKIEELAKAKEELLGTDNKENNGKTKSLKNNKK